MVRRTWLALVLVCAAAGGPADGAEDTRTQYPAFLAHSYFGVSLGAIGYDFSQRQLAPGFEAQAVGTPPVAARVTLYGRELNRFLAAQVTYMRPVLYVTYRNVNGDESQYRLLVHFGAVTLKPHVPLGRRLSVYGEAGLGLTSRRGMLIGGETAIPPANYASVLLGGGLEYRLGSAWDLTAGAAWSPGREHDRQPDTLLLSGGFRVNLHPLPPERVAASRDSGAVFPRTVVQAEYTTGVGYGVNDFVSKKVPIFWGGAVKVSRGLGAHVQRNVFHTRKLFGVDVGASASWWTSRGDDADFATLSVYPLFRLTPIRTGAADLYFFYSLAGPTWISRSVIDGRDTGGSFTFQDFMGVGAFLGTTRRLSVALKINHYSNGNLVPDNAGLKVPLTVALGITF
jgi:opacity protein-like surface antigen